MPNDIFGIKYDLRYTELCLYTRDGKVGSFNDKEVHDILLRSGIKRKQFDRKNKANEWFITDLADMFARQANWKRRSARGYAR